MNESHQTETGKSFFIRNAAGISSVEFFWGMGMPILIESTFLQLFLRSLGASYFLIGLLPVFLGVSIPVFSLASAYLSSYIQNKRTSVLLYHMMASVPVLLYGLYLLIFRPEEGVLLTFMAMYCLFSIAIGFTMPAWQSYLVSLFSQKDSLRGLSIMYIVQSASKLVGSFFLYRMVARFALSLDGAALVFTIGGFILFFGAKFFALTREVYGEDETETPVVPFSGIQNFMGSLKRIFKSGEFRIFIGSDFSYFAITVALSFYGNYARDYGGVAEELVAGLFVAASYGGGIVSQVLFGWLNLSSLKNKFIISKVLALAGMIMLLPGSSLLLFLGAAVLLGASRSIRMLVYPPAVKAIAGVRDTTPHFALISLVEMPFSAGLPLAAGLFLDSLAWMGGNSYRILFGVLALILLVGLVFALKLRFGESDETSVRDRVPDREFEG